MGHIKYDAGLKGRFSKHTWRRLPSFPPLHPLEVKIENEQSKIFNIFLNYFEFTCDFWLVLNMYS